MTIVVTGGGSGGHITPILAVAAELKKLEPTTRIVYIGQRGDSLSDVPERDPNIDEIFVVSAGKFRRYHSEGLKQLFDIKTVALNLRDIYRIIAGFFQSRRLMKKIKPDIVFTRGGFVSVPVALAATTRHIPFITHDSDAIPSLANRIIARWAVKHAVALPREIYPYPREKTETVGVPIIGKYSPVDAKAQAAFKQELKLPASCQLLFIIGGGLGAQRINQAIAEVLPHLLKEFADLRVVHGVGRANETVMNELYAQQLTPAEQGRVDVRGFLHDVYRYSGAADIVVTRAGATNLAEFAVQGKACIVIPNPFLTGGHQLKNAAYLEQQQAAMVISETDLEVNPNSLGNRVQQLLQHPEQRRVLEQNFAKFGRPDAARELAVLLLEQAKTQTNNEKVIDSKN